MTYGEFTDFKEFKEFKDLTAIGTACDEVFRYKAFNIAKNPKYDGYQRGLASMVFKFFDKKSASGIGITTLAYNQHYLDLTT